MDMAKAKEMTDRDRLQDEELIYSLLKEHIQDEESKVRSAISLRSIRS
jgi:hypothetical protein